MPTLILLFDPPKSWGDVFLILGGIVFALAFTAYVVKKGADKAGDRALEKWKSLAEANEAESRQLKSENEKMAAQNTELKREVDSCEEFRKEVAQTFLRYEARERQYQKCINRLERRLNIQETPFDDPGSQLHQTQS